MIKIPVTYKNFDGEEVNRDLYFHLSMRELTQMELADEGMHDRLVTMLSSGNGKEILNVFEELVKAAYGERQDNDPDNFLKNKALADKFMNSQAYDALFFQLVQSTSAMIEFITGLIPENLMQMPEVQQAIKAAEQDGTVDVQLPAEDIGPKLLTDDELSEKTGLKYPKDSKQNVVPWAYREPTDAEVRRMSRTQLLDITSRKSKGWTPKD